MKIILAIVIILFIIGLICIICSCMVSSKSSKKEEYRLLDPKVLDDDTVDFNIEDIFTYDEKFTKKDGKNGKS